MGETRGDGHGGGGVEEIRTQPRWSMEKEKEGRMEGRGRDRVGEQKESVDKKSKKEQYETNNHSKCLQKCSERWEWRSRVGQDAVPLREW